MGGTNGVSTPHHHGHVTRETSVVSTITRNKCNTFPDFYFYNPDTNARIPFYCKSWNCPTCGAIKRDKVINAMAEAAVKHRLSKHLTLTLDPKKLKEGENPYVYLRKTWNKMRVYLWRLGKKRGRRIKYELVVGMQYQNEDMPHRHILLNEYIPFKWLKKAWKAVGGGSVFVRYVKVKHQKAFVKGYFSHALHDPHPSHTRRYATSQSIKLFSHAKTGWEIQRWISKPEYSKGGYHHKVERVDFAIRLHPKIIPLTEGPFRILEDFGAG